MGHSMGGLEGMFQAKGTCVFLAVLSCTSGLAREVAEGEEMLNPYMINPRPVRFSFGLGKRSAAPRNHHEIPLLLADVKGWDYGRTLLKREPSMEEDVDIMEDEDDSEDMDANINDTDIEEDVSFNLSPPKRSLFEFKGKRGPYAFGLGKRSSYGFGLGKRGSYGFGLGKRSSYGFGLGKRSSYGFGLGKRAILVDSKGVLNEYEERDPYEEQRKMKRSSKYGFGLGKRSKENMFDSAKRAPYGFGLGK